ncbi:AAA family ATPase [Aliiroseovarius sp. KMU-50]|uniref:AAA family ATPase n=1 Tax=Aliiroseovarius salicola TaxID=3009082 RepID=A0ABT4W2U0_9RHOB|nr:adenylate/guanylate cyclase domain-containing protein [Aliiroseovarius sp. KMU-50]MDA5094826.1 AAA family ATPase [Aliiroseovarius sp. KMU-50]
MRSPNLNTIDADANPGQKRWAAVLFADLENFTAISEQAGPEKTYELITSIVQSSWRLVEKYQGSPIEYAGDSILAAFGAPIAVENASLNACLAALALQAEMAGRAEEFQRQFGAKPKFRIGIAGGVIVIGTFGLEAKMDLSLVGETVNRASRIQNSAKAGEILCSQSICDQVKGHVSMTHLGPIKLKGLSGENEIFRLNGPKSNISEFEGRLERGSKMFVGREDELETLSRWINASPDTAGIIQLHGPAGIGKSRLLFEALNQGPHTKRRILTAHCNRDISTKSLAAFIPLLHSAIGWKPDDTRDKLETGLSRLLGPGDQGAEPLSELLLNSDDWSKNADHDTAVHVRAAIVKALSNICSDPGNLVIIEDAHWIDPVSADILRKLAETRNGNVKFLFSRRSDHTIGRIKDVGIHDIALKPLLPANISEIIIDLLGVVAIPYPLLDFVTSTTEGNSLFVEETIRYLISSNQVVVENGTVSFKPDAKLQSTSGNLQHLILSRFDALDASTKDVLLIAATKGRRFSEDFISQCVKDPSATEKAIARAATAGLIEPDGDDVSGHWRFAHALIANAISQSVLARHRAQLHATVASGLEIDEASAATFTEELSYHHDQAGNAAKAVYYLSKSAEKALAIYSIVQADEALERAFDLIGENPNVVGNTQFAEMLELWARTLNIFGDFKKLNIIVEKYLPRLSATSASKQRAICLTLQAISRTHAGERTYAINLIEQAVKISEEIGDPHSLAWAKAAMLRVYVEAGVATLDETKALYDDIRASFAEFKDPSLTQMAIYSMSAAYRESGQLRQSERLIDEIENYGRKHGDTRALGMAGWARAINKWLAEDIEAMAAAADQAMQYSLPDTGDWRVGAISELAVDLMQNSGSERVDEFLIYKENALHSEDMSLYLACGFQYCVHSMRRGRVRIAWNELQSLEEAAVRVGTSEQKTQISLLKARLLIALAGLEKSTAERPKMALADIIRAITLKIGAVNKANLVLHDLSDRYPFKTGLIAAHIQFGFGLIAKSQRQQKLAKEHFRASHDLFSEEGLTRRAEQSLDLLQGIDT